eukprot:326907-Prymnesium_polylepis.1
MWIDGGNFSLVRMVNSMRASSASLAQPRIGAIPGQRSSDYEMLRATSPFPRGCRAVEVGYVEVQAPIFRVNAFRAIHRFLLSEIPDELLHKTVWGIPGTWCRLLHTILHRGSHLRPACALLDPVIVHLDKHLIEIVAGGRVRKGERWWTYRRRANALNGSLILPQFLQRKFPAFFNTSKAHKAAKRGRCRTPQSTGSIVNEAPEGVDGQPRASDENTSANTSKLSGMAVGWESKCTPLRRRGQNTTAEDLHSCLSALARLRLFPSHIRG